MSKMMAFLLGLLTGAGIVAFWGVTLLAVGCGIGIGLVLPLVIFTND